MKRIVALFPLLIVLCSCATLAPPKEVFRTTASQSYEETVFLLLAMTEKCWTSKVNPLKDGIVLHNYLSTNAQDGKTKEYVIEAYRVRWAGPKVVPFVIVTIGKTLDNPTVTVDEGDFASGLDGAYPLGAAAHVEAWLKGDTTCKEFARTLWHS